MTSFSKSPVTIPKNMLIAVSSELRETKVAYEELAPSSKTEVITKNQKINGPKLNDINKRTQKMRRARRMTGDRKFRSTTNFTDIAINI